MNFAADGSDTFDDQSSFAPKENPPAVRVATMDLKHLDPLEIEDPWDGPYQHLLDQAQDLLELGSLAQAEAKEQAEAQAESEEFAHCTQTTDSAAEDSTVEDSSAEDCCDEDRAVLKFSNARGK